MTVSRFRRARELACLTLDQASRLIGLSVTAISDLERGEARPTPGWLTARILQDMAIAYRMPIEWLRGDPVAVPDSVTRMLAGASVSPHDRDVVLEFAGMLCARSGLSARTASPETSSRAPQEPAREPTPEPEVPVADKRAYVRGQRQTRDHHCHWPGCDRQVPPAMWGCRPHWFRLPKMLRDRIWKTYVPGQEIDMTPSREYLAAAGEVQAWIESQAKTGK